MRTIPQSRIPHWFTASSITVFLLLFAFSFHDSINTAHAQEAQAASAGMADKTSRAQAGLETLREHWDSEIITGVMVDEIKKALDNGTEENLEPLLTRLELLRQAGKVYAPDFALWWDVRGRSEIGGNLFWRRDLLNEAINLMLEGGGEDKAYSMIRDAASTGDPVAGMWKYFVGSELVGRLDNDEIGSFFLLLEEVRAIADSGDADAAFALAVISMRGDSRALSSSPADITRWLEMAANAGNNHAVGMLIETYSRGRNGIERDLVKAKYWREKSGFKQNASQLRVSSQNNLKQLGLVCRFYANEAPGEKWPPLSSELGQFAMNASAIYPEYLTDPNIYISPAHPDYYDLIYVAESDPQSGLRDHSYWYLGYAVMDEEQGLELVKHMREAFANGELLDADIEAQSLDLERIFQLREGIERFFITDFNDLTSSAAMQSKLPVLIERPGLHENGANVLFMDGHVEFIQYPGKFPMTKSFIQALESLDDLKR